LALFLLVKPAKADFINIADEVIQMGEESGVWRTISGRKVFIRDGQSLSDAMKSSGKFGNGDDGSGAGHISENDLYEALEGLPDDEAEKLIESIRYYTDDYNYSLSEKGEIENLNRAIEEAKSVHWNDGELYRGLSVDQEFIDSLSEGDVIETGLPSSWSSDASVATEFASGSHLESSSGVRAVLVDTTQGARNAISIKDFSRYEDEQEVLYSGNSSFKVTGFREEEDPSDGSTIHMIEVEEVRRK
jgi:hypothetical protein